MTSNLKLIIFATLVSTFLITCSKKVIEKAFISPPFPKLNQEYFDFQIDSEKGDTLLFSSGSRIIVPPDIWVDSTGKKITGEINIRYREFSDAGDVFLAGIPLAYDTTGRKENFVTAGMFEIRSYKDSREIFIDKTKSLTVQMASNQSDPDFNFYYLDESAKNWKYVGNDKPTENTKIQEIKDSIKILQPEMPFPFDKSYFALNYESILDVYYKDNYYTISENRNSNVPKGKAREYGLTWSGIFSGHRLTFNGVGYRAYQMVWQNMNGKNLPSITKECWVEELISLGNNIYTMKLMSEDNKKASIKVKVIMPIKHLFAFSADDWQKKYDDVMAKIKVEEKRLASQFAVYRTFEVNSTGFYNWDKIYHRSDKVMVKCNFAFDKEIDTDIADVDIYYFIEGNKSFIKLSYSGTDSIMMVPDSTAKFIAVLSENEAALFSNKDYNKIDFGQLKSKRNYTFNMKSIGINTKDDFKKLVEMN